jgi:ribonuclease-3 family protein
MHAGAGDVPPEARLLSVFGNALLPPRSLADVSPRSLAHLGDAVFHLFEREREIAHISSAKQMHTRARVNAAMQADLLDRLMPQLRERELDIVRRARNVKVSQARRADQAIYRLSTAFEALLGYLYLTDLGRLKDVLALTIQDAPPEGSPPDEKTTIKP